MKTGISTQQVLDDILACAKLHGEAPGEWRLLVAAIDDSEATQRQLLYNLLSRMYSVPADKRRGDPEITLLRATLKENYGIRRV